MTTNEYYKLNNGIEMPKTGLGTWFIKNSDAAEVVRQAVKCGYRLIDTAQAYMNEAGVGEGIRTCGVKRDELFVIDKIAAEAKSYDDAKKSIDDILSKTGLDYLDQIIIHAPQPWRKWRDKKNRYFAENKEVWRALEEPTKRARCAPSAWPTSCRTTWRTSWKVAPSALPSTRFSATSATPRPNSSVSAKRTTSLWKPTRPWLTARC